MTTKQTMLRNLGIVILTSGLLACNSAEQSKAKYSKEGKEYLAAGELEKATLAFKNVLQIDPKDWENHYQMGEVLSKQGKMDAAFREFSLVLAQDDNHVMAKIRVGQLLLLNRNVDQAEKLVNDALLKEPENVEALVLKAGVETAKNNNDAAISTIEKALQLSPGDVAATMMQASIQIRLNKQAEATQILKTAIEKKPEDVQLRSMLGGLYAHEKQYPEAEQMLISIIKIKPKELEYYRRLALFQLSLNQLDNAEATLRDALAHLPENDNAKTLLLDFLTEKRSPDIAIAELLPMIEKNPEDFVLRFKLVNLQLAKKDVPSAETSLREIIDQDKLGPNGISARNKLAAIYLQTNRNQEARNLNKEVLEANPRDGEALTLRGQFSLADNHISEAIADFRSVLVDQPNNVGVLKLLATAHVRNNEEALARENLEKVISYVPDDEAARLDLASLLYKAGQKDQSKQQIEALLKKNPQSQKGLEAFFRFYVNEQQWEKAQAVAKQVEELKPNDPTGFYMSGLGYQAAKKFEASIDAFQLALTKKPDAVEPLNELIKTYISLKQPEKALVKLQQIIKQQPDNLIAYNLLGGVYISLQKFTEANAAFLKALEIKPDWFAPYRSLAMSELLQKHKTEAIGYLRKGIDKTQGNFELVIDLARLLQSDGQTDKVLALYEESYQAHPDAVMAVNNLASYLSDHAPTPANLERAAKMVIPLENSNNPSLLDTVGWIAYRQGNYEKAQNIISKVIEMAPNAFVSQYHLGMIYYKQNDNLHAKEALEKAIAGKTPFDGIEEAKEVLKKL
jgi:tetratricopeptide (TPR) repeat protein